MQTINFRYQNSASLYLSSQQTSSGCQQTLKEVMIPYCSPFHFHLRNRALETLLVRTSQTEAIMQKWVNLTGISAVGENFHVFVTYTHIIHIYMNLLREMPDSFKIMV